MLVVLQRDRKGGQQSFGETAQDLVEERTIEVDNHEMKKKNAQ